MPMYEMGEGIKDIISHNHKIALRDGGQNMSFSSN